MAVFTMPKPSTDDAYLAGRIERYLSNKGYVIGAGGVVVSGDSVAVDCERDPAADVAGYQHTELPEEDGLGLALVVLKAAVSDIRAKAPANRTPAERAILAMLVILRELREGG